MKEREVYHFRSTYLGFSLTDTALILLERCPWFLFHYYTKTIPSFLLCRASWRRRGMRQTMSTAEVVDLSNKLVSLFHTILQRYCQTVLHRHDGYTLRCFVCLDVSIIMDHGQWIITQCRRTQAQKKKKEIQKIQPSKEFFLGVDAPVSHKNPMQLIMDFPPNIPFHDKQRSP